MRVRHILFDTAPTGHTHPAAATARCLGGFLEAGRVMLVPGTLWPGWENSVSATKAAVDALADPAHSRLVLVARAQSATLRARCAPHAELAATGLRQRFLVVNGVLPSRGDSDPWPPPCVGASRLRWLPCRKTCVPCR